MKGNNMAKQHKMVRSGNVTTPAGIVSFPSLFQTENEAADSEKRPRSPYSSDKYVFTLVFRESADLSPVEAAVNEVLEAQLKPDGEWSDLSREDIALPIKDNALKSDKRPFNEPGFHLKAKTIFDTFEVFGPPSPIEGEVPPLITASTNKDSEDAGVIYAGIAARAQVHAFSYQMAKGNPGIGLRFTRFQKLADGERIGGNEAASAFATAEVNVDDLL